MAGLFRQSEQGVLWHSFCQSDNSHPTENVAAIATTLMTRRVPLKSPIFRYSELHIRTMIDDEIKRLLRWKFRVADQPELDRPPRIDLLI
jgi:hypothetical protein